MPARASIFSSGQSAAMGIETSSFGPMTGWSGPKGCECRAARSATEPLPRGTTAGVIVGLLLSALTAEVIGIHAIFGAFLLGAVVPHASVVARPLTRQLEHLVTILLLPAFFAFTGMRTRIELISGLDQWMIWALIILIATLGKFGGTLLVARLPGLDWRAAALGTLMNTRGPMELIVLNIGLDLGVISPPLFAMMVVMALVTTMATAPVLQWLLPQTASAPAMESARVTHGGQESSAARAQRRQAEGPSPSQTPQGLVEPSRWW